MLFRSYKETDAVVFSDEYGKYALYTFVRDANSSKQVKINRISSTSLPLEIVKDTDKYEYRYNISIATVRNDNKATYHSYFMGKSM